MIKLKNIDDVRRSHLCTGCGACAGIEPDRFEIKDVPHEGRRPFVRANAPPESGQALAACPGAALTHTFDRDDPELLQALSDNWGPIYQVVEGYAADSDIRFAGSSGGAATALSLYCIEQLGMQGALQTRSAPDKPYTNTTTLSRTKDDLLSASGSRYAPASPCEALPRISQAENPCVFVGKPCDVAAAQSARRQDTKLDKKLGLTIAFFCAGVPSTEGNLKLMQQQGVAQAGDVQGLRYRGNGWPGNWTVDYAADGARVSKQLTYEASWGFLQKYRQWRCHICPDHTGEFADIAVGDPWYRDIQPGEAGSSLILARTRRGLEILEGAVAAGYLIVGKPDPSLLPRSQPNLLGTRANLWGRLLAMRLFAIGVPEYRGFQLFDFWRQKLGFSAKLRSVLSTVKRIYGKKLYRSAATEP